MRICVTWDVLLVLLNPPARPYVLQGGSTAGHPISVLTHRSKRGARDRGGFTKKPSDLTD
jgi:hypothetical protein